MSLPTYFLQYLRQPHSGLKLTLQRQRLRCAELEQKIVEMEAEIKKSSVEVDHQLGEDLTNILSKSDKKLTPFMELFWQQQKKLMGCSSAGVRFHPMII